MFGDAPELMLALVPPGCTRVAVSPGVFMAWRKEAVPRKASEAAVHKVWALLPDCFASLHGLARDASVERRRRR